TLSRNLTMLPPNLITKPGNLATLPLHLAMLLPKSPTFSLPRNIIKELLDVSSPAEYVEYFLRTRPQSDKHFKARVVSLTTRRAGGLCMENSSSASICSSTISFCHLPIRWDPSKRVGDACYLLLLRGLSRSSSFLPPHLSSFSPSLA